MLKKDVKKNMPVMFTRRNGKTALGVVHALPEEKANGVWVEVNTGTKKEPEITNVRIEKLTKQSCTTPSPEVLKTPAKPVAAKAAPAAKKPTVAAVKKLAKKK